MSNLSLASSSYFPSTSSGVASDPYWMSRGEAHCAKLNERSYDTDVEVCCYHLMHFRNVVGQCLSPSGMVRLAHDDHEMVAPKIDS